MKKNIKVYGVVLIIAFIIGVMAAGINSSGDKMFKVIQDEYLNINPRKPAIKVNQSNSNIRLYSRYAILVRLKDNKVLLEINGEKKMYPASLTKIMTALIAVENIKDLNESIELPSNIFPELYKEDASMAGFLPNEQVSASDLLYGAMLPSGAEASVGLAVISAGSEDNFVRMMNIKAEKLAMKNTHFTNVCGLQNFNHYSTVKDLSILLEYALKNRIFRNIFTSEKHSTAATNLHPNGITFYNTMFQHMSSSEFHGGKILGGKTGYTGEAGLCLASLGEKNGEEYILITGGAQGNHKTEQYDIDDAKAVYGEIAN